MFHTNLTIFIFQELPVQKETIKEASIPASPFDRQRGIRKSISNDDVMKKMRYENIQLAATVSDLERQIIALEEENNDYKDPTYELSKEMKVLKYLCELKISKIESKCGRSKESDEIKEMVEFIYVFSYL
jgi:hypothetical protein